MINPLQIRVILVEPQSPGNIGSVARAMANMGVADLALVNPCDHLAKEAHQMASNAQEVLESATLYTSLAEAGRGCHQLWGFTARNRKFNRPLADLPGFADQQDSPLGQQRLALVFGNERTGLSNEDLALCTQLLSIPTASDYQSLNLAQAVMVALYELQRPRALAIATPLELRPDQALVEGMQEHFFAVLDQLGFFQSEGQRQSLQVSLADLIHKTPLQQRDIRMIRGFFRRIEVTLKLLSGKIPK